MAKLLKQGKKQGRTRMLLLALQVAMHIAADVPQVEISTHRALCCKLRPHVKCGFLNVAALTADEKAQVLDAVKQFPNKLLQTGDLKTLVCDTGASSSVSGFKDDFIEGTLTKLDRPKYFDGIAGMKQATHKGCS